MTLDDVRVDAPELVQAELGRARRRRRAATAAVGLTLVLGLVARFLAVSHLWLDEALTVNIARLPVGDLFEALRHDGSPPLYYLILHVWMDMAGTGDVAVRALSGLMATAALPLMWMAGRRLTAGAPAAAGPSGTGPLGPEVDRDRWVAWAAVLLLASSPFAIHYATEARMYSLVVLLVLVGFLALDTLLHRRSRGAMVVLGLATGLLLLTHYWAFYLVGAVLALLARRWRDPDPQRRAGARRALGSIIVGSILFVPWVPTFLEQMRRTGTPWGASPQPRVVFDIVLQFAGGLYDTSLPLGLFLYALVGLGIFGAAVAPGVVTLDFRGRPAGRMLAAAAGLTMALAIVVGQITRSAFAVRYAAVVLPLVLLAAALGTATLSGRWAAPVALGVVVVLGFVTAGPSVFGERTSAGRVAAALRAQARPGDVVAYCPDQMGPSVSRLLAGGAAPPSELVQVTFPRATGPEFVDWVDYAKTNKAARTAPFARMLLDRAGPDRSVWVVWSPGYRTFGTKCQALLTELRQVRPDERRTVTVQTGTFERPGLVQYPPG